MTGENEARESGGPPVADSNAFHRLAQVEPSFARAERVLGAPKGIDRELSFAS